MALILLDANVLLYAWNDLAPHHKQIKAWTEKLLSGSNWVGLPWVSIWAFLRITTNPRAFANPLAAADAFEIIHGWLELPNVSLIQPGPRHEELLRELVVKSQAAGPLVTDAVLAALAIEHGASLASVDRDFSRFTGLSWVNPLDAT